MKDKPIILIVDDQPQNIELLESYLVPQGYEIVQATNGEEALGKLSDNQIDLILLDVIMPGMDGFEVTRRVRQDNTHRLLPIILVTVLRETEDRVKGIEAGCDDFISMPIDKMELLTRVRSLLKVKAYNDLMSNYRKELESEVTSRTEELKHALKNLQQEITKRKRAEDVRLKLQKAIDTSGEAIFLTDPEGIFTYVNPGFTAMYGYNADEIVGKVSPRILKSGSMRPDDYDMFWKTLLGGQEVRGELVNKRKDGRLITIEGSANPIFDEKKNIIGFLGIQRDIAERKRAEEVLRKSEEKYRDIFTWAPVGIYQSSIDGKILVTNKSLADMLGYDTAEDLINKDMAKDIYYNEEERQKLIKKYDPGKMRAITNFEILWKKKNGTPIWIMLTAHAIRDKNDKTVYYEGFVHDITEWKRAEENIRMLSRAMEQSPASNVITDLEGKIEYVNPKFIQLTGYTSAEALGQNPRILKSGEKPAKEYKQLWETLKSGKEWQGEFHNKKKNGVLYWESASISPIKDASGKITHYLAVKEDITERKSLQAQLLRSQRIESIGTLAGGVAHDLNNVLAPIMLAIEILRKSMPDERSQKMLETLESSAYRGSAIIKQILGFARGVQGESVLIQFRHIINEITNIMRETFPKSITIKEDITKNIWTIVGDPTNLHQVLLNLCVNARDAMPDGGSIHISVENKIIDEQYSRMNLEAKPGQFVMLSVEDTGCGMPPAILEHIFEPFFTTKEIGKGTGLGLSTVHAIVKSHGGFLNVYSEVGKGTTFKIYLPAAKESGDAKPKLEKFKEMLLGHGELIMVVDDEISIQQIIKQTLETYGYQVITASDGTEAIAHFASRKEDIALVLTDMMMPIMDGPSTIKVLRRMNPNIKIITSSGLSADGKLATSKELGVNAFLMKPYNAQKLLEVVHSVLNEK